MRHFLLGIAFFLCGNLVQAQIVVDAKTTDWADNGTLKYYDKEAHVQYDTRNNDSMLYVCVKITDQKFQMKALVAGMTLYIDTLGKRKQQVAIQYPIRNKDASIGFGKPGSPLDTTAIKLKMQESLKTAEKTGFYMGNGIFNVSEGTSVKLLGAESGGELVFEYAIPLSQLFHQPIEDLKQKQISVIICLNQLEMPEMGGSGSDMPPNGAPPFGGSPGGEMPDFAEIEQLFQKSTTILKYSIL